MNVSQLKSRRGAVILGGVVVLAVAYYLVLSVVQSPAAGPAPQRVHVSIIGNLGGTVMIDGGPVTRLDAYDGTDGADFTAARSVTVTVDSSGAAPWCHINRQPGEQLAEQTGATPSIVPQTMLQGYGPAKSIEAPTIETVTCQASLG